MLKCWVRYLVPLIILELSRHFKEEFEDTKGVISIHISKKNRQHNGQKENKQKDKQRSTKHIYM